MSECSEFGRSVSKKRGVKSMCGAYRGERRVQSNQFERLWCVDTTFASCVFSWKSKSSPQKCVVEKLHMGQKSQQIQAPRPRRAVALVTWVERLKLIFYFSFIEQYSFTLLAVICA